MTPLTFGIIGCSRIAKRSVIPAIIKSEYAELEIIGSRSTDKAKEFASEFNCEKFGSYEDVILDDSVDFVYISTPIHTHAEWSNKSTAAGKHVYVEKSSTNDLKSAIEMVESAKENNVRIMEGFMFRFHPQHQKVKELIKEGKIGEVKEDENLEIPDSFIWVTLYQIKQLMKIENFVGPHVRGIISYL